MLNRISIHLWDIAGQERWINTRNIYYSGSQAALMVGDLSRKRTFEQIETFWHPDLIAHCGKIPFILLANKDDLQENITDEEIYKLGRKLESIANLRTSAKTGKNVKL
jgi:small GTP-binding protein